MRHAPHCEIQRQAGRVGGSEAAEGRARPRLRRAPRGQVRVLARELHLPHLDANPLAAEVAERGRETDRDARLRHADEPVPADHQLEPALGLDQVLGHGGGQRPQARGVELRREVRKVDAVGRRHDALEGARARRAGRLPRGQRRARCVGQGAEQAPEGVARKPHVGVEEDRDGCPRVLPQYVPGERLSRAADEQRRDRERGGRDGERGGPRAVGGHRRERRLDGAGEALHVAERGGGRRGGPVDADEQLDDPTLPCRLQRRARRLERPGERRLVGPARHRERQSGRRLRHRRRAGRRRRRRVRRAHRRRPRRGGRPPPRAPP